MLILDRSIYICMSEIIELYYYMIKFICKSKNHDSNWKFAQCYTEVQLTITKLAVVQ